MMQQGFSDREQEHATAPEADLKTSTISVVIVSYNARELLRNCLASIESEPWAQAIVVDNDSSDGSPEMVKQVFPWVTLIHSENHGYGAAANVAAAGCSSPYVLILNSDTVLQPGALQVLRDYLDEHPQVAVVGPRLVNPDRTRQPSCFAFPTPLQTLARETSLPRFLPFVILRSTAPDKPQEVPWVLGAALAIRKATFDAIHGFDESFFMYFEEVDLCYRLRKAGWHTHYIPGASVMHIGGASTQRHRAAMVQQLYRSLCHFYQQHYSTAQKLQLKLVLTYLMLRNIVKDTLRSFRAGNRSDASENLLVWRSILSNIWSSKGWLKG